MKKYKIYAAMVTFIIAVWLPAKVAQANENTISGQLIKLEDKIYYMYSDGSFAMDWLQIGSDWFFFCPIDGTMAIDTTINGFMFGKDGRFIGMAEEPDESRMLEDTVYNILSMIIRPDMSEEEKINACYMYIIDNTSYKRTYDTPAGDWTGEYAMQLYTSGEGNCYRYASAFAYLVSGLGYEAHVVTGETGARRGGTTPHGWAEVKLDDEWYIFDTEMQDANGKDYYKKTYENYPSKPLIKMSEWEVALGSSRIGGGL